MLKSSLYLRDNLLLTNDGCPVDQHRLDHETCVQCIEPTSCGRFLFCVDNVCRNAQNLPQFQTRCSDSTECGPLKCILGTCRACSREEQGGGIFCSYGEWVDGRELYFHLDRTTLTFIVFMYLLGFCLVGVIMFRGSIRRLR